MTSKGKLISLMSSAGAEVTVIDCGGIDWFFLFDDGEDDRAALSGFTIQNAVKGDRDRGGAIYSYGSPPVIEECGFLSNSADYGGAISLSWGANSILRNYVIRQNYAVHGGGILIDYSSPTLEGVSFEHNTGIQQGGAIWWTGSSNCLSAALQPNPDTGDLKLRRGFVDLTCQRGVNHECQNSERYEPWASRGS